MSKWQPIESAPKSPDWIIGLFSDGDIKRCVGDSKYWFDWYGNVLGNAPTNWIPLPHPDSEGRS